MPDTPPTSAARWPVREIAPGVAADVLDNRKRPIRFIRLGRFVLIWEKENTMLNLEPYVRRNGDLAHSDGCGAEHDPATNAHCAAGQHRPNCHKAGGDDPCSDRV